MKPAQGFNIHFVHRQPVSRCESRNSEIQLVDVATGELFPSAPPGAVCLTSVPFGWRGIIVEWQRLEPQEMTEHSVNGHALAIHTGQRPVRFGLRGGRGWVDHQILPGDIHLLTDGVLTTPRWLDPFDEVSIVLDRQFVAGLVRDGLPEDRIEFATQRSLRDATIASYIAAFRSELEADCPNGLLYADTLVVGFALHLLGQYGVAKPRIGSPRGKLSSVQLRAAVDFIQAHLSADVSLVALAAVANASPFHFARHFRATVGLSPHQFVLHQRIHKSIRLISAGKLPLSQIALEAGFYDQPHFTRAFHKVIGTTPARYSAQLRSRSN